MIPAGNSRVVNIGILVVGAIVVFVGWQAIQAAGAQYDEWHDNSQEWCSEHDGEFEETIAGGEYSGLECTLPDGKTVDMGEVAFQGYPESTADLPRLENTPYRNSPLDQLAQVLPVTAGIAVVVVVGFAGVERVTDRFGGGGGGAE